MASPLYAVVSRIKDNLNDISLTNLNDGLSVILRKNHFLTKFQEKPLTDTNNTTVPFEEFELRAGKQFFEYLESYMHGKGIPPMSEELTKRFRQSLFEIFQNAAIHSNHLPGFSPVANFSRICKSSILQFLTLGWEYEIMFEIIQGKSK